jgi:copper(I)-binding protein
MSRHRSLTALLALGWASVSAAAGLTMSDAWVREAPPGTEINAAYFTLRNEDGAAHILTGAVSPQFDRAELHATRVSGGQVRMQRVEAVEVPAHGSVRFEPGGYHLMLIRPRRPLQAGDSVTLTLQFKDADAVTIQAPVRQSDKPDRHHMRDMGM